MAMRSQVYEWMNQGSSATASTTRRTTSGNFPMTMSKDKDYDVFIGGVGNQITKPAETSATQFVVIPNAILRDITPINSPISASGPS